MSLGHRYLPVLALLGDMLAAAIASWAAPDVWALFDDSYVPTPGVPYWQAGSIILWIIALRVGQDEPRLPRQWWHAATAVGQALAAMVAAVLILFYVSPFFAPRGSTFLSLVLVASALFVWRLIYGRILRTNVFRVRVGIVGIDHGARRTARVLIDSHAYDVRAFLGSDEASGVIFGVSVVHAAGDLWTVVDQLGIDQLVVSHTQSIDAAMLDDIVHCFDHGVEALPATTVYEELTGRVLAPALESDWYAELPTRAGGPYAAVKRLIDVAFGWSLLILTMPLMFLIAAVIGADSGRPIFFRQVRVGKRGQLFVIHKFRTMRPDAELDGQARWASVDDDRVTRVGRFLRRSRLDELPQLWDVVRGAMSLIGPRPERPEFAESLAAELPLYRARTLVRPGLTGWAQVQYRYAGTVADNLAKLEYDLFYLRHIGPLIDFTIALRTIFIVLRFRGQ